MQNFTDIPSTRTLSDSLAEILNNDKTSLSLSSGTTFPTTNLQIGMPCYRTDQQKLYILTQVIPSSVWKLWMDFTGSEGKAPNAEAIDGVGTLGSLSTQNANAVAITGGSVSGITDLAIPDGGTGASTASAARSNLGLAIGSDVQAYSQLLDGISAGTTMLGMKNRVINGDFSVWQRGTSRFTNVGQGGTSKYYADRWTSMQFQQAGFERVLRSGAGPTSLYAMRVTSSSVAEASVGTRMSLGQMIESINCVDLAGQQVTLSFWLRFSSATFAGFGAFVYGLWEVNTADQPSDSTGPDVPNQVSIANGTLPTAWTRYTLTITPGASMKNLVPRFTFEQLANTATNGALWYEVADVQVEHGSVATRFERRPYGHELSLCQRYYEYGELWGTPRSGDNYSHTIWNFRQVKRTTPTITVLSNTYGQSHAIQRLNEHVLVNGAQTVSGGSAHFTYAASAEL